jgi:PAS domain S-box-containing protein
MDQARQDRARPKLTQQLRASPAGRLQAYVRGRRRGFWLRQTLTLIGAVSIWMITSPALGMVAAGLALSGEILDIAVLAWVSRRIALEGASPRLARIATLSGGLQALTIAACVVLTWHFIPLIESRFFATAFLVAAIINAGLPRPYFRPAADLRLVIFAVTSAVMLGMDLQVLRASERGAYGFFAAAFGILVYISALFIAHVQHFHDTRRRAEAELEQVGEDNQRLALVAKYANDSVVLTDQNGLISWVNEAFTRLTGYAYDEAVGHSPGSLLNTPQTSAETLERLAEARAKLVPVRTEIFNRTKGGGRLWMETSITPIFDAEGNHRLSIAVERDISEGKAREAELARARAEAEEAVKAKARFLANMSHEIRTPMNGVLGVAELLAETPLSPQQADYVETIVESGRALLDIINDILDLAKLQSGKTLLETRAFSLTECIERVLRILRPVAAKKGLELVFAPPDVVPEQVLGDEGKLRQVLMNLIGNAVKFTHDGQVVLRLRPGPAGRIEIDVADTGIGIAPDRVAQIFESFTQADNAISRQFGGTGLGLTISAMLAELMGGEISVHSDLGRGSVFTLALVLPPAPAEATPLRPAVAVAGAEETLPAGLRILVAEDNRTNMMIVRKMLDRAGVAVIEAVTGAEAVDLCRECAPDLVLMDISMPVMDGLEATRLLRAEEAAQHLPHRPILALTANVFGEDREACRAAGLDGFLVKPLSRTELYAAIRAHVPDGPAGLSHRPPPSPTMPSARLGL